MQDGRPAPFVNRQLSTRRAGRQRVWERADVAMRKDDVTHLLFQEVCLADGHDLWKSIFEKTSDGHCTFYNKDLSRDTATVIERKMTELSENISAQGRRHWRMVAYTIGTERFVIVKAHLATSWSSRNELIEAAATMKAEVMKGNTLFPSTSSSWRHETGVGDLGGYARVGVAEMLIFEALAWAWR